MAKRAIIYARVSTEDQADRGFSLAAQVEAGRRFAEAHGFSVTQELIDEGVSGALALRERPAGKEAWALLRDGGADALIVQNVDRLSRDVVDLLVSIRDLLRVGAELYSLDMGRITSEYDIMLVIRGWQSSDERSKIRERSMRGRHQKASQGLVIGGKLPYGYTHERDDRGRVISLTPIEEQAAVVRLIFQWYTVGDEARGPMSIRAIARRLSEAGIPTAQARHRTRTAWTTSTVSRILNNSTYAGEWHYNSSYDGGQQFTVTVPAIVDTATWRMTQAQRERNRRKARRNARNHYLLTGIIQCGCGSSMHGNTKKLEHSTWAYYRCNRHTQLPADECTCREKHIRADALESAVWNAMLAIIRDPASFEAKLREAQTLELEEQEPKRVELAAVEAMIAEAESEAMQLERALRDAGRVVGKLLKERMTALDERYARLEARRDQILADLRSPRLTDETIAAILQYTADVTQGIEHADHVTKRHILDRFDARVVVEDGRATLHYALLLPDAIALHLSPL